MITELIPLLGERKTLVLTLAKEGDNVRLTIMPGDKLPGLTAVDTPANLDANLVTSLTKYANTVKPLADAVLEAEQEAARLKAKQEAEIKARAEKAKAEADAKAKAKGNQPQKPQPKPAPVTEAKTAPAKPVVKTASPAPAPAPQPVAAGNEEFRLF